MSSIEKSETMESPIGEGGLEEGKPMSRTLRWWPLVPLLIAMFGFPYLLKLFDAPSLPVMMISLVGPAGAGLLVLVWWLFASRASIREKLIGIVVVVSAAVLSIAAIHPTMREMGTAVHLVPNGIAAFAIPLLLLAAVPKYRLPIALICSVLTFAYWDMVRMKGVTGAFVSELDWRWSPTAEQEYLEGVAAKLPTTKGSVTESGPVINLASAAWPSFRGPERHGKQPGVAFDSDWIADPPKKLWQTKIGPGWSSFTVAGDRLFTQEQRGENEAVLCLNANTGDVVWAYEYPSRFWETIGGAGPRATPTIADEGVFALGGNGILVCLKASGGGLIWQTDLKSDADRQPPQWGFSASPLITQGIAIVHAGGRGDKGVIAYDALTGAQKWSAASGDHSYSSPHLANFAAIDGVLMLTNAGLQFLEPQTGKVLWQHDWPVKNYRALQPLVVGNKILMATSLGLGTRCLEVSRQDDNWIIDEKWTSRDMKPDFNDFVEHHGFLYGFDGSIFACVDLSSGKRRWKGGRYGNGQVLLLPKEDQLLITSESGELVLVQADSDVFIELARMTAIEGKTWNHPVVIGNRVYLRNAEQAACYELKTK